MSRFGMGYGRAVKTASRDGYRCVLWSKVPFLRARTSSGSCSLQNKSSAQQFARSNFHLIHPFAPGKDPPKDIQGTRPAVRIHSARCQEVLNKWFESSSDGQPRPDWFQSKHKAKQRVGGPDAGEWKLIWHPRSRMDSPTIPARKVLRTLKDDEEKDKMKKILASGAAVRTQRNDPAMESQQVLADELRPASNRSKRIGTAGSRRPGTSRSMVSEAGEGMFEDDKRPRSRLSTGRSGSMRGSRSELSLSSTITKNSSVLLDRIKGLEDALKQEQTLRQKMQSLIALESWVE